MHKFTIYNNDLNEFSEKKHAWAGRLRSRGIFVTIYELCNLMYLA